MTELMHDVALEPKLGPDDVKVTYAGLLRLDTLLRLQYEPRAHDELMFVIVHQTHELWFKLMLHELTEVRDLLQGAQLDRAAHLLGRVVAVQRLLADHWSVLDTMLPADYLAFRSYLEGGSGFESVQYREIEFLAGAKDASYVDKMPAAGSDRLRLLNRLRETSIREAFIELVDRFRLASVRTVFEATSGSAGWRWALLRIAELLLDFDNAFAQWRARHTLMVERQIGNKSGTGGSSGASYLRSRLHQRLFPELWDARTEL